MSGLLRGGHLLGRTSEERPITGGFSIPGCERKAQVGWSSRSILLKRDLLLTDKGAGGGGRALESDF